jgi:hypothetical protein
MASSAWVLYCYSVTHRGWGSPSIALGLMTPIGRSSIGGSFFLPAAPIGARMDRLPNSLAIALWTVGTCWLLAIIGYALGASGDWLLALVALGILTGLAEWYLRRS